MALKKSQQSLKNWTDQKWRTKSGKPSTQGAEATGERYLPEKAIKSMSDSEYAASTRKKREDTAKGKQHSKQPDKAAKTSRRYRSMGGPMNFMDAFNNPRPMLRKAEGGEIPEDTYDNVPPEEQQAMLDSQLPDAQMEEAYMDYVLNETLDESEKEYLQNALAADPQLSSILDKVVVTAAEFSGAGEVEGPGTGVSDSIPARLSDGEFVFTKKATDQIGADNLQKTMDAAERAYDGGLMSRPEEATPFDSDDKMKSQMAEANQMPSIR